MDNNKIEALYDFLMEYPMLQYMYFNFGNAENGATFLLYDNDTVINEYNDGFKEHVLVCQIAPYKDFSTDILPTENIQDLFTVQKFRDWIQEQNDNHKFPFFQGCTINEIITEDISIAGEDPEENLAKYMFPIKIYYLEE